MLRSKVTILLMAAALLGGCRPSCASVCDKVRGCDLSPELAQQECVNQCNGQASEVETDDARDALWVDHLQCVAASSCAEIEGGACYDAELFGF